MTDHAWEGAPDQGPDDTPDGAVQWCACGLMRRWDRHLGRRWKYADRFTDEDFGRNSGALGRAVKPCTRALGGAYRASAKQEKTMSENDFRDSVLYDDLHTSGRFLYGELLPVICNDTATLRDIVLRWRGVQAELAEPQRSRANGELTEMLSLLRRAQGMLDELSNTLDPDEDAPEVGEAPSTTCRTILIDGKTHAVQGDWLTFEQVITLAGKRQTRGHGEPLAEIWWNDNPYQRPNRMSVDKPLRITDGLALSVRP